MERLQKIIAQAGVASRRTAEKLIREGRVSVNGAVVTELGSKASPDDEIRVDGKLISTETDKIYLMLHKPAGYVTTFRDPEGRKIVMDLIGDMPERVYPVGRLDYDSEGLLILTNDGEFAQKLQHPSYMVPKIYEVKIKGNLTRKEISEIRAGIRLEDGLFAPLELQVEKVNPKSAWLRVVIREGRNRVLRRLFEKMNHPVQRLVRIGIGDLPLGSLKPGDFRHLKDAEVRKLKSFLRKREN